MARRAVGKAIAAGLAGGLAGAWTMTKFQQAYSKAAEAMGKHSRNGGGEDATMKAAGKISHAILRCDLTREQRRKAGPLVHYAFGTAVGGLYGAAAEFASPVKSLSGVPFGAVLFAGADELAVPAFKLSGPAKRYPASAHIYGLASHVVYGLTTELVRRLVRRTI
ncbi:MAG TPA: DUF1440 domain-containing protein [Candidatus Acidoferrales bacterium]|nr:DUF1440 domain-containing protein [Candidatus Acidoferrales bacterium]